MYTSGSFQPIRPAPVPLTVRQQLQGFLWVVLLLLVLLAVVIINPSPSATLRAGSVSPQDIRAPRRITFVSQVRTQQAREAAAANVAPIYTPPDRALAIKQLSTAQQVADFITKVRDDSTLPRSEKVKRIADLEPVQFSSEAIDAVLSFSDKEWEAVTKETYRLLEQLNRRQIREDQLSAIRRQLPYQVDVTLNDEQALVVTEWVSALLQPNSFLDEARTEEARENARRSVPDVQVTYEQGQIIVREGEIVQPEHIEALEALGLQSASFTRERLAGTVILVTLLVLVLAFYVVRVHPQLWVHGRLMAAVGLTLVLSTLAVRLLMSGHSLLAYLTPVASAAMLLSMLVGPDVALIASTLLALLVMQLTGSFELAVYTFVGSSIAALVLWRVERLQSFVSAGLLVGLANLGVVLAFALQETSWSPLVLAMRSGLAVANGALSASVTLAGFYILSSVAGVTTFLQLMELARPTHPLFKQLLLEAPGTYHHSIMIGNLAERAAEAIGADALLVRVGAYYHDIGKITAPHYFVENQANDSNPHDELGDPEKSAQIIINHVAEGVRLARKFRLPPPIVDFIRQHHGTTRVEYFYRKACEQYGPEAVDESKFRYPGPRPQTREAAILMLADAVEAAVRAEKPEDVETVDAVVCHIIQQKLDQGQLVDTPLTLQDLEAIRRAFVQTLSGMYHSRVTYPSSPLPQTRANGHEHVSSPADQRVVEQSS